MPHPMEDGGWGRLRWRGSLPIDVDFYGLFIMIVDNIYANGVSQVTAFGALGRHKGGIGSGQSRLYVRNPGMPASWLGPISGVSPPPGLTTFVLQTLHLQWRRQGPPIGVVGFERTAMLRQPWAAGLAPMEGPFQLSGCGNFSPGNSHDPSDPPPNSGVSENWHIARPADVQPENSRQ